MLQKVKLPSALAQVGAHAMISFLFCWFIAQIDSCIYFLYESVKMAAAFQALVFHIKE